MKKSIIFTIILFMVIFNSVTAQDLIVLRNGNMIEARVLEISPTEIRYKRFDHLDGPTIVIFAADVLSIRYENGRIETINAGTSTEQTNMQVARSQNTAIDTDKFIFGINANAGGALNYIWEGSSGASVNIELGKGNFNSEINLMFPIGGFGILLTFNRFWHQTIGGAYLGGGIGYAFYENYYYKYDYGQYFTQWGWQWYGAWLSYTAHSLTAGINAGYKFVTGSGIFFRTGAFIGFDFGFIWNWGDTLPVYIKPDLAIGWTMR